MEAFPPQADDPLARALPLAKVQYGSQWEKSVNGAIDTNPKLHAVGKSLKHCNPGDSSRDPFILERWRSLNL